LGWCPTGTRRGRGWGWSREEAKRVRRAVRARARRGRGGSGWGEFGEGVGAGRRVRGSGELTGSAAAARGWTGPGRGSPGVFLISSAFGDGVSAVFREFFCEGKFFREFWWWFRVFLHVFND
jgi:hypothetical protein